jgi:hypothetical protein
MALAFAGAAVLLILGDPLRTASAPAGIVSFELCAIEGTCQSLLEEYGESRRLVAAGFSLGFDYVFLFLYPSALAILLRVSSRGRGNRAEAIGAWLSWGAVLAGLLDAIENAGLLAMAWSGQATPAFAWTAALAATAKFALVGLALLGAPAPRVRLSPRLRSSTQVRGARRGWPRSRFE